MTERRLVMVTTAQDAPAPDPAIAGVLVLDTAWTPLVGTRSDLAPVRPFVSDAVRRADFFIESYTRLEAWTEALGLPDRATVDGVSWWYRRRFSYWLWLHERLLWRAVLDDALQRFGPIGRIELDADILALADVVSLVAVRDGIVARVPAARPAAEPVVDSAGAWTLGRILGAPGRRRRRRELARRSAMLTERVEHLRTDQRQFLFLTDQSVHQMVRTPGGERRRDAFLGAVVERLVERGQAPVVIDVSADPRDDRGWPSIAADPLLLPSTLLATRWASPEDIEGSVARSAQVADAVDAAPEVALEDGGVDFGPLLRASVRESVAAGLPARLRQVERIARAFRELRPAGLVLIDEYGRTEWLVGARKAGVPVFAVQHGIIYPWHLGYRHPRRPGIPLADHTFLFGDYERRVLLEDGGYLPDEVEVTGAPRLDLVQQSAAEDPAVERASVRRDLGVATGDRLLLISTTRERLHRHYYLMHALGVILDGDLPNVHLVFKQHPTEADEGPYRELVTGLAAAAGRSPPPITVVRDMDLFRLLRASDAHLGLFSTVLTDAVATGTPNLIAMTQAHADLLGYVDAGVARPVSDAASLLAALDDPQESDGAARAAFLEDHFRSGDASGRIRDALLAMAGRDLGPPHGSSGPDRAEGRG